MNLRALNFARQTILMDSRNGWIYLQRVIIGLSAGLVLYNIQSYSNSGSAGLQFFDMFFNAVLFLMTVAGLTAFCGAVAEEREEGTLQILLMTGINPLSLIFGRAAGKFFQIFYLFVLLVPSSLFAVTLGGISLQSIISLYLVLIFWLMVVFSISLWSSVFCSRKKEAMIIAGSLIFIIFIVTLLCGTSPLHRQHEVLTSASPLIYFPGDILIYTGISVLFVLHAVKNFKYTALFPISFLDEFEMRITKKLHGRSVNHIRVRTETVIRFFKNPIVEKDQYIYPKASVLPNFDGLNGLVVLIIIFSSIAVPAVLGLFFIWIVFASLTYTWKRIIDAFSREVEEKTLSSLVLLPYSTEELLKKKLAGARTYDKGILFSYIIFASISFLIVLGQGYLLPVLVIGGMVALYFVLIYSTALTALKVRELTSTTSFAINLFIVILYFSFPLLTVPFYIAAVFLLRRQCINALDQYAELS